MKILDHSVDAASGSCISPARRDFLKAGGALLVTFAIPAGAHAAMAAAASTAPAAAGGPYGIVPPQQLDSWLAVSEDGTVTAYTGRIDMGTGTSTVYAQAIAEELDVPVGVVRIVMGDTARTPEQGKSTASNSVTYNLPPMRQAAAEARFALLELAAAKWKVPVDRLDAAEATITMKGDPSKSISYKELIGGRRFNVVVGVKGSGLTMQLVPRATLKDPSRFKVLGTSVARIDIPAKARGEFLYVHDVVVDGMLHGTLVLPPQHGAKLVSVDGFPRQIPGIVKVVTQGDFVGIVAETEQAAVRARNELKVTWSTPAGEKWDDIYRVVRNMPLVKDVVEEEKGDVAGRLKDGDTLDRTFYLPFNTHGMMGPSCAIADWRDGELVLWSGTQWPDATRRDVATMMGIAPEKVRLVWVEAAGSYGRLGTDDAAADAALLSRAVGRPVRLQWQRQDEHTWSPMNPGAVIRIQAALDKEGRVGAWNLENWSASHSRGERGNMLAWRLAGGHPDHPRLSGGADKPSYVFANTRTVSHYTEEVIRAIYMRSVGGIQNTFAIESMMDELAAKAGADPIEFRMRHLSSERMKAVLKATADKAGWKSGASQKLASPRKGILSGRGVGMVGTDAANPALIATIVDVEVDTDTGEIYVPRVYVGFDAGRIANPDGLRNQIEGGTIMGISRALKEEVTFRNRGVATTDWASYPVLRFSEVPQSIDIVLLDNEHPPKGAGEPPNVTPAAAIGNAVFAATGIRARSLPLTPDRMKKLLDA